MAGGPCLTGMTRREKATSLGDLAEKGWLPESVRKTKKFGTRFSSKTRSPIKKRVGRRCRGRGSRMPGLVTTANTYSRNSTVSDSEGGTHHPKKPADGKDAHVTGRGRSKKKRSKSHEPPSRRNGKSIVSRNRGRRERTRETMKLRVETCQGTGNTESLDNYLTKKKRALNNRTHWLKAAEEREEKKVRRKG